MKRILISMLILLLISSTAFAQRGKGRQFGKQMEMKEKNLDNLRLIKLLDLLELTEEQNDKFISAYSSMRISKSQIHKEMQIEVEILSEQLHSENPDESLILNQIEKVESLMERKMLNFSNFHDNIKEILTVVQMGKMVLFENRFERELLETVRGFREKHLPMSEDAPANPDDKPVLEGRH